MLLVFEEVELLLLPKGLYRLPLDDEEPHLEEPLLLLLPEPQLELLLLLGL